MYQHTDSRLAIYGCFPGLLLALGLTACGGADGALGVASSSAAAVSSVASSASSSSVSSSSSSSSSSIPSVYQRFTSNVTVTRSGDTLILESDGIPNHGSPYFPVGDSRYETYNGSNAAWSQNPNHIASQTLVFRIPVNPLAASNKSATPLGPIGISLNGVPFYNQYAGPSQPLTNEINSFDQYDGHPQATGQYHYHAEPYALTAANGKDGLLGFLLDGFPVYGPTEAGVAVSAASLDAYHGHVGVTVDYPNGIYHYHITATDPYINGDGFYGVAGTVSQ